MKAYGLTFSKYTDAEVEMKMIQLGGTFVKDGTTYGNGLLFHYKKLQSLFWRWLKHNRWSDLILETILTERITSIMGSKDSGKTNTTAAYALSDYFCFPEETLILMSSTDTRGLELRVWGQVKSMYQEARERYPFLAGKVNDTKHAIFTDALDEDCDVRDMRKGIVGVPCLTGQGTWVGMEKFVGIKQKRRRLIGDELQFMAHNYLKTLDNLDKGDFKFTGCGNPIGNNDPLDVVSEPEKGWDSLGEVTKTTTWRNKYGGITINLVGTDSPNFDPGAIQLPFLINQTDVDRIARRRGRDSAEFYSQILGVRKAGINAHRVLTKEICRNNGAFDDVIWNGEPPVKLLGIDAGYGGDDCVAIQAEIGKAVSGQSVIKFHPTVLIPVAVSAKETPEVQIAIFTRDYCASQGILDENVFFEAGMRATLAVEFARVMSAQVNAVNFGGPATQRPVNSDLFIFDPATNTRRPKQCREHYSKFVTELWFSVRELVESKQARNLPEDVADEFGMREWYFVSGDRYELETKLECKQRMGHSPNLADAAAIAVEGARRIGFVIERLRETAEGRRIEDDWLLREQMKFRQHRKKQELQYT